MTDMVILSPCFTCGKSLRGVISSILNLFKWTVSISESSKNQDFLVQFILALQMRQSSSILDRWWNRLTDPWTVVQDRHEVSNLLLDHQVLLRSDYIGVWNIFQNNAGVLNTFKILCRSIKKIQCFKIPLRPFNRH